MTRGNRAFSAVVNLVFALLIGAFLFFAFVLIRGVLLLCLVLLIGFVLGRVTGRGVRTDVRPLREQK